MLCTVRFAALATLAISILAPAARAGGAVIVGDPSGISYPTIQAAIDAATDGAVLFVGPGNYTGFTITNKSLAIFAPKGGAYVAGDVAVSQLEVSKSVVLSGLSIAASNQLYALTLTNDLGAVRVEQCTIFGDWEDGGAAVRILNSESVAFDACSLIGADGFPATTYAGFGGDGVEGMEISSSKVVVTRSTIRGGNGGSAAIACGSGADGIRFGGTELFVSKSLASGGSSGGFGCSSGTGLDVSSGLARVLDSTFTGPFGSAGTQGNVIFLPGQAREFSAPSWIYGGATYSIAVDGVPGDRARLAVATRPDFKFTPSGYWLVHFPSALTFTPLATLGSSGSANFTLQAPKVSVARQLFEQGFVIDSSGANWLSNPLEPVVIDRTAPPDCNGNGISDIVDVLEGTAIDCDNSLLPDVCEIAAGQKPDCNHDGVPDSCDIASGTSLDSNHDGIPDECQYSGPDFYVDASAPSGGDGSSALPFNRIQDAIDYASSIGDRVIVRDGVYLGLHNTVLNLHGKQLVVQSENGPSNCVIDCQGNTQAIDVLSGESGTTRFQGFTIEHATIAVFLSDSSPTISNCVIRDSSQCGVFMRRTASGPVLVPRVENCAFIDNVASSALYGAAIDVSASSSPGYLVTPNVVGCTFQGNRALVGGAIDMQSGGAISHCVFLQNGTSSTWGGGGAIQVGDSTTVTDCLFAGNTATNGGAIQIASNGAGPMPGPLVIAGCTFSGNSATQSGGAIAVLAGQNRQIANCVMWNDVAPNGGEIALLAPPAYSSTLVVNVGYSDVMGGQAGVYVHYGILNWGAGNLALDPKFVDPDGPDNDPTTFADNVYRLQTSSPCLDAGDNTAVPLDSVDVDGDGITNELDPLDLNSKPRFKDLPYAPDVGNGSPPLVDLGCYERQS